MSHINNTHIKHDYVMTRGDYFEMSFQIGDELDLSGHTVASQYKLAYHDNAPRLDFNPVLTGQVVTLSLSGEQTALISVREIYFDVQFTPPSGKKFTLFHGSISVILDRTRP